MATLKRTGMALAPSQLLRGQGRTPGHAARASRRPLWRPLCLMLALASAPACQANRGDEDGTTDMRAPTPLDSSFTGCATASYDAKQATAALLVVLDRSSSMTQNNKWATAAQAIVQALDQDVFDSMSVGLYAAPSKTAMAGPMCILGLPVRCEAPPFPVVDLDLAGAQKSNAPMGVRRSIKDWLSNNSPVGGLGDASPLYAAMESSIKALQSWKDGSKRLMLVVTDGTISCNQFSNRPGFMDCNGCDHDWEDPSNIVKLLKAANEDPSTPIETFIVGVPGADTYEPMGCSFPPYHMRLALSAIAYAGSPNNVPASCTGKVFTKDGGDPAVSCHFDMTQVAGFKPQALADTITQIRGKALGCTFDLPQPPSGTLNRFQVNVEYSTPTGGTKQLVRRRDSSNSCAQNGCWDYDKSDRIELLGKACADIKGVSGAQVKVVVGCDTVIG